MFTLDELQAAADIVYRDMPPTPHYAWPLLAEETGVRVVVKHENHTPTGAFKVRGGLVYMDRLKRERPDIAGVISATRGNHGQSLAFAGARAGIPVTIVVPRGNSREKNAAMRAFGAELVEHGADFDEARVFAETEARARGLLFAPSFAPDLVRGVATYAYEFLSACPELETVYVPIGLGSGICGMVMARDLLGHKAEIVGVVAEGAPAYALSFEQKSPVNTNAARTFADGMACRVPDPAALDIILKGVARVITLTETEIADAIRLYYRTTHNVAEGAGAAPLGGLVKEKDRQAGKDVGIVLCGQNIDTAWFRTVLSDRTPDPST